MVENDNDTNTGTNVGRVKGEFLFSYFVRQVYVFGYPTAHSHPCKLTSKILALSVVKNIILLGGYVTSLGTYNVVTSRVGSRGALSLGERDPVCIVFCVPLLPFVIFCCVLWFLPDFCKNHHYYPKNI